MRTKFFLLLIFSLLPVSVALSGCAGSYSATAPTVEAPVSDGNTVGLGGTAYGGRQPVGLAHIYMYAASTAGYNGSSVSLLKAYTTGTYPSVEDTNGSYYVVTNSVGAFYLSAGQYACTPGQQVYVFSIGGNAGGGANSAAGMMAVLGQCLANSQFAGITNINISEVSTIAAAYALSGYAVDGSHVSAGTSALASVGLANAFASAALLDNVSATGYAVARTTTPNGNGTVPQTEIHTLANILASCINSTGPTSPACTSLFADAESGGTTGTQPADTAAAAINIAHHPGSNVAKLFILSSSNVTPYTPNLGSTQPNDFTIAISYTVAGLDSPGAIAVDGSGNVWAANPAGNSVSKISPLGVPASGQPFTGGGLASPYDLAIDASGNAWVTNLNANVVSKFTNAGAPVTSTGYAGNGHLSDPVGIAIDGSGNVCIFNYSGNTVSKFTSAGAEVTGSPYSYTDADNPGGIAIDASGDAWVANISNKYVSKLTSAGAEVSGSPFTSGGTSGSRYPAITSAGGAWITNYSANSITLLSSTGTASTFTGGGLNEPNTMALDGAGNAWIANSGDSSISEFTSAGVAVTSSTGYNTSLNNPFSVVVDGSGNVWVANDGNNTLVEYVGLGVPVVTPLAAAVANKTIASLP